MTKIVEIRHPLIYYSKDIARDFGVSARTVRRWISHRLLKPRGYRRIGGSALQLVFTSKEIDEFLDRYLVRPEDMDFEAPTPRGKDERAAHVARLIGTARLFAG